MGTLSADTAGRSFAVLADLSARGRRWLASL
jgi:hypothetical protein